MGDRMIPDRVEFLLMLARDAKAEGDQLVTQQSQVNAAHAQRLRDLWNMAEETRILLAQEMRRFGAYLPREEEPRSVIAQRQVPSPKEAQDRREAQSNSGR